MPTFGRNYIQIQTNKSELHTKFIHLECLEVVLQIL